MKTIYCVVIVLSLLLTSCNNEPSLQKYFVENQEKSGFVAVDISSSILNLDKTKLSLEQSKALKSFNKMNVLAFKIDEKNKGQYATEKNKVVEILKDTVTYKQLMKFGSGKQGASISYVGDENHINEFVIYGNQSESGFAVVRVLGNDMKPEDAMTMISVLQQSNIDMKQLEALTGLMKK
ncbi:DUF4252 domain-containing protein [Flavobacterium sp.]|uniref:DUF4252 domain-containing protein n=1 Tax=Flavobacterium sp. TaxID=239 RepID=UPI003753B434